MEYIDPRIALIPCCVLSLDCSRALVNFRSTWTWTWTLSYHRIKVRDYYTACIISLATSADPATLIIPFLRLSMRLLQSSPGV